MYPYCALLNTWLYTQIHTQLCILVCTIFYLDAHNSGIQSGVVTLFMVINKCWMVVKKIWKETDKLLMFVWKNVKKCWTSIYFRSCKYNTILQLSTLNDFKKCKLREGDFLYIYPSSRPQQPHWRFATIIKVTIGVSKYKIWLPLSYRLM